MDSPTRWQPPKASLVTERASRTPMPATIQAATACLVCDALLIPALSQGWISTTLVDQQPALMALVDWIQVPVGLVTAAFIRWRRPWPRSVLGVLVALSIGDYVLAGSVSARFASFPRAAIRDWFDFALQAAAIALAFSPSASRWYRRSEIADEG
jgi:hypothetical protein